MATSLLEKWRLMQAALADPDLSPAAKCVMGRLLFHLNADTGQCTPSFETLARGAGVTRRTVVRAIRELRERAWIERDHATRDGGRSHLANEFRLAFERGITVPEIGTERSPGSDETVPRVGTEQCSEVGTKRSPKQGNRNKGRERGDARMRATPRFRFSAMDYLADRMRDDE